MKKLKFLGLLIFLLWALLLYSQKEGDQWVIGYWANGSPEYSVMHLDFSSGYLQLSWLPEIVFEINETQANICDRDGKPIIWTNGMEIMGADGIRIADTIAYVDDPLGYWNYYYSSSLERPFGFPEHDGALILPFPGSIDEYSVIYHSAEFHPNGYFQVSKYLESRIKFNNYSSFTLISKDVLIGSYHKWFAGPIIASRHANGRDWWVTAFEEDSPNYFSYLLDPSGIKLDHEGNVDSVVKEGLGQAAFSSQGNYMARMDAITLNEGQYITLFSFNRCTGDFIRLETFHTETGYFTGAAFSPSERYMYADDNLHLWQWDLWSSDIRNSQTLVDTFDGFVQPGWFQMQFGPMMTAPDGRIYIVPPAGSSEYIHVIDRPDLPAGECRFLQHYINLQVPNGRSAPNIPNFRLGPLDGSSCDTLGLDNLVVARWRYEEDQPGIKQTIRFTDLSFYDPEIWHWEFDDGSTSTEVGPVHTFENGLYHVCLTVSNANSSDSSCQWIEILETGLHDEQEMKEPDLSISPNPFQEELNIHSKSGSFRKVHIQLYDMHGRNVFDQPDAPVPVIIFLPSFPCGIYFCKIQERDGKSYSFKLMRI